jgi:hypothetical protein
MVTTLRWTFEFSKFARIKAGTWFNPPLSWAGQNIELVTDRQQQLLKIAFF